MNKVISVVWFAVGFECVLAIKKEHQLNISKLNGVIKRVTMHDIQINQYQYNEHWGSDFKCLRSYWRHGKLFSVRYRFQTHSHRYDEKKNWYRFIWSWLDKEIGFFQTCTHRSVSNKSQWQKKFLWQSSSLLDFVEKKRKKNNYENLNILSRLALKSNNDA